MTTKHILLALSVTLTGCPSTFPTMLAQPKEIASGSADPYTHRASRLTFPATVAQFSRTRIVQYDVLGEVVSVGYSFIPSACPLTATLSVYAAPSDLHVQASSETMAKAQALLIEEHFNALKKGILQTSPRAKLLREERVTLFQAGGAQRGRRALFEYEDTFEIQTELVYADVYLFTVGRWALKYKFVFPSERLSCASSAINDFLLAYSWPHP